ncbi:unnamed protein product [Mycena citricolor]|uniref:DUF6924 domain-containing protein n=1 Tax=Mycena citricolor TaxID=2018698 RepID=A0AAD2HGK6_9AGAR|nr:unnamed protein product [Mycena citricolor]CAK5276636.1 unnamed protein product [Mycena citricolor]
MTSYFVIFVNTPNIPSGKDLNRAFLLVQDFRFNDYPPENGGWKLVTLKDFSRDKTTAPTFPPLEEVIQNEFAGMSLKQINEYMLANEDKLVAGDCSPHLWLVIDEKGFETSTCIVCEHVDSSEEEQRVEDTSAASGWRGCRLPFEEAHGMIVNLDIANMDFEEYVDEEAGLQDDGTYNWQSFDSEDEHSEEPPEWQLARDAAFEELRQGGFV